MLLWDLDQGLLCCVCLSVDLSVLYREYAPRFALQLKPRNPKPKPKLLRAIKTKESLMTAGLHALIVPALGETVTETGTATVAETVTVTVTVVVLAVEIATAAAAIAAQSASGKIAAEIALVARTAVGWSRAALAAQVVTDLVFFAATS